MQPYKASRLKVLWIQCVTGVWTIWYSTRVIITALMGLYKAFVTLHLLFRGGSANIVAKVF